MKFGFLGRAAVAVACGAILCQAPAMGQTPPPRPVTAAVDKAGAIAHYRQARQFFDQEKFEDANGEVESALKLDPDLQDAKLLQMRITPHLTGQTPAATGGTRGGRTDMLTPEEISRIRLAELGANETELRGSISRKTLEDFWNDVILKDDQISADDKSLMARERFLSPLNFAGQLRVMQTEKATKYLQDAKLATDPEVMRVYKRLIHPFLIQNCAACHGAASDRKFRVFGTLSSTSDAQAYTTFYEISQWTQEGAALLDRQTPEHSLFLQYGLARKDANTPHPGNVEVTHKLSMTSQAYTDMLAWLKSLAFPIPDYGVSWKMPGMPAAPAPVPATTKPK